MATTTPITTTPVTPAVVIYNAEIVEAVGSIIGGTPNIPVVVVEEDEDAIGTSSVER